MVDRLIKAGADVNTKTKVRMILDFFKYLKTQWIWPC